jgi:hypothetical protein
MQEEVESMVCRSTVFAAVLLLGALVASPATADFVVDIRANIDESVPIVGWGVDLWFCDPGATGVVDVVYGADWLDVPAEDPDPNDPTVVLNLEAITTYPDPTPGITGNALLATVTFAGVGDALSLMIGDHNPYDGLGDLNEGFIVQPPPAGHYAQINRVGTCYCDETPDDLGTFTIGVFPEPASLTLLLLGGLAVIRRR